MRKLYKIQFAVSPNPDISFGLDLAGLHRILAGRPLNVETQEKKTAAVYFRARYRSGRFRLDSLHLPWKDKLPSRISDR